MIQDVCISTAGILTADILTTDILSADILTADILTADILTTDILTTDIYCYNNYTTFCKRLGSQSARYTQITLDLFLVGPEDDSRESKHVAQR